MTQDEIIHMARDAGFSIKTVNSIDGDEVFWFTNITDMIERFAALVAAHERDACAKMCDEYADDVETYHWDEGQAQFGRSCSAAIRARGKNGTA